MEDEDGAPLDLTGYELRMQVRDRLTDALLLTINTTDAEPYASITPAEGKVAIAVPSDVVAAVSPTNAKVSARWDAELYIPGVGADPDYVVPLVRGTASFLPRVTQVGP
ncbi:MAG TPA: hypothetical protein VGK41_01205 [Solirubrobacterales bacterium]